jgi:chaperonin cofactor prefoldin
MTESEVREYCRFLFDQTPGNKQINMIRYTLNEIEKETVSHIETKYARIGNYQNLVQMPYDISELKDQLKEVHEKIELLKRMNRILSSCLDVLNKNLYDSLPL